MSLPTSPPKANAGAQMNWLPTDAGSLALVLRVATVSCVRGGTPLAGLQSTP